MSLAFTTVQEAPAAFWLGAGLTMGIAGAAHCAGMCGGFPLALMSVSKTHKSRLGRSVLYNLGRGLTYVTLASIVGALGLALNKATIAAEIGRALAAGLSVFAGLVIAVSGLLLLGVRIPFFKAGHAGGIAEWVAKAGRGIIRSPHPMAPVTVGIINGLLPCPLVYAMLATVFTLGAFKEYGAGMIVAAGFAAGTIPVMAVIGAVGGPVFARHRASLARVSGVLLLFFAVVTVVRGVSMDSIHNVLPGMAGHDHGEMPDGHVMLAGEHFDANGNRMEKLPGMSDEDYVTLIRDEADTAKRIEALLAAGDLDGLRTLNQQMSAPEGKRAYTLTRSDIDDILADEAAPEMLDYRCPCCGTPKQHHKGFLKVLAESEDYAGFTLLIPKTGSLPWRARNEP